MLVSSQLRCCKILVHINSVEKSFTYDLVVLERRHSVLIVLLALHRWFIQVCGWVSWNLRWGSIKLSSLLSGHQFIEGLLNLHVILESRMATLLNYLMLFDQLTQLPALVMRLSVSQEPLRQLSLLLVRFLPVGCSKLRLKREDLWWVPWLLHSVLLA